MQYTEETPDTIAAIATPAGEGGIAVIRVSGANAKKALRACFRPAKAGKIAPRRMMFGRVVNADGSVLDEAMAVFMPSPATYTREDVCEIQCHGGADAPARVLGRVLETGLVRMAGPGEFTRRAFLNGRIDLSEAEAVMQMISARSDAAGRAAARQMEGGVSAFVWETRTELEKILALVSAAVDFPEEIDEEVTAKQVLERVSLVRAEISRRCDPRSARAVREGVSIALAGKPNVGKSSIMNAAAGYERAIVSDIPGTTRDTLTERISFQGITAELIDTAGQHETGEAIEALGVERARRAGEQADCVLLVLDGTAPLDAEDERLLKNADSRYLLVINKEDRACVLDAAELASRYSLPVITVSARTGEGIGAMLERAYALCGASSPSEDAMTAARHIACAKRCVECLDRLRETVLRGDPLDLVTDDLWQAMYAISEITGENAAEDVIDRVFADFCVGK